MQHVHHLTIGQRFWFGFKNFLIVILLITTLVSSAGFGVMVLAFQEDQTTISTLRGEQLILTAKLAQVETEKAACEEKLEAALIPEASVGEAFKVHIVDPVTGFVSTAWQSTKNLFN